MTSSLLWLSICLLSFAMLVHDSSFIWWWFDGQHALDCPVAKWVYLALLAVTLAAPVVRILLDESDVTDIFFLGIALVGAYQLGALFLLGPFPALAFVGGLIIAAALNSADGCNGSKRIAGILFNTVTFGLFVAVQLFLAMTTWMPLSIAVGRPCNWLPAV